MVSKNMLALSGLFLGGSLVLCGLTSPAFAETRAYWRFEDGTPGEYAAVGQNVSADSAGQNALSVAIRETRPLFNGDVPLATIPQTNTPNRLAIQLNYAGDFFSRDAPINKFDFSPKGSNAWTVELSFKMTSLDGVTRLFGRDGKTPDVDIRGPLQLLVNGTGDTFYVRAEILDGSNTFRDVASPATYKVGKWYNLAATADSTSLKLYIDALDGKGYQLVGQKAIQGALNGTTGDVFSIGRGYNDRPTDWIGGLLDEIRVSDTALTPAQFLFAKPDGGAVTAPATAPYKALPPIKIFSGADPHAAYYQGKYWLYITGQNDIGPKNPVTYAFSSPDLKTWTKSAQPALQFKDIPWIYTDNQDWHGAWAPAVAEKNGKYYYYYSVGPQTSTAPSRLGVAVSNSPAGPFKDSGKALFAGGNGFEAIDPMVFADPKSGKYYMYAGGSAGSKLRVWEMAPDMVNFAKEIPVDNPPQFTEGAFMHYANGQYYLSYSHGGWNNPTYSAYYATSQSPTGPWQFRGQILQSDMARKGPGHHSFVEDPRTGQWYIVYHRWQSPNGGNPFKAPGGRSVAIQPITYDETGAILPVTMNDENLPQLAGALRPR
ncbi:hypothetical protein EON83_29815, partial [bacterium]